MGRFINADTYISTGQSILGSNMFAYCYNNPVNYEDPTGHIAIIDDAAVAVGVFVVSAYALICYVTTPAAQQQFQAFQNYIIEAYNYVANSIENAWNQLVQFAKRSTYDPDDEPTFSRIGRQNGNAPRNNRNQNNQFKAVVKQLASLGVKLTQDQIQRLHQEISKQGLSMSEIFEYAMDMFFDR